MAPQPGWQHKRRHLGRQDRGAHGPSPALTQARIHGDLAAAREEATTARARLAAEAQSQEQARLENENAELKEDMAKLRERCEELQSLMAQQTDQDDSQDLFHQLETTREELFTVKEGAHARTQCAAPACGPDGVGFAACSV